MKVHSDVIIFEILKLYFEATNETSIDVRLLKNGFYTLNSIVSAKNNLEIVLNFESELE